jgi:hypothetical protein
VRRQSAPLSVAGIELPDWLLGGVVAALITAMLAWFLGRVARRCQAAAASIAPVAGADALHASSAAEQTDAEVLRGLWDENEGVKNQRSIPRASNSSGNSKNPVTEDSQPAADA